MALVGALRARLLGLTDILHPTLEMRYRQARSVKAKYGRTDERMSVRGVLHARTFSSYT